MTTNNHDSAVLEKARDWLWPLALAAMIFHESSCSQVAAPDVPNIDKLAHFMVYGLLGTLIARVPSMARSPGLGEYWAVVLCSLFGLSDEFHQSFTPGRSVEFGDWLADTCGAALAVFLYAHWRWYQVLLECPLVRRSRVEITGASASDSAP